MSNNEFIFHELKDIDPDDIDDVLRKVETSFGFKFGKTELKDVKTFGELGDIILNKIAQEDSKDCTSQQAFYKLRDAVSIVQNIDRSTISINTLLEDIFPRQSRRKKIKYIETELGFSLKILQPKMLVSGFLAITIILSLISLFFSWQIGLAGFTLSVSGAWLANYFGKEFELKTFGEVADKMSRENYLRSRRDPNTVNKNEILTKLKDLFANDLLLSPTALTKDSTFT